MTLEEFIKAGCIQCGGHDFDKPIGQDFIRCIFDDAEFTTEEVGNFDSETWTEARSKVTGEEYTPPRTVRYENEEQFVKQFEEAVDGEPTDETVN